MTIDAYLAALERSLPRISRRRVLAEAQEHLRDSAATHRAAGLSLPAAEAARPTTSDRSRSSRAGSRQNGRSAIPGSRPS